MADAADFVNPKLRIEREERPEPGRPAGTREDERRPPPHHAEKAPPPPRRESPASWDLKGEDLLKLLDGLTQATILAGLPTNYEPPAKLREITGQILDNMGFPEDLLPAQAFNSKGRWKILVGCILAYGGLGIWGAIQQRKAKLWQLQHEMAQEEEEERVADAQKTAQTANAAPQSETAKETTDDAGTVADPTDR